MASSRRRLVLDHSSLRRKGLPPNYLFPSEGSSTEYTPDDITQLTVLLTGANGTPFSQGLWRLHLKIPEEYPKLPPKATFKTRIFHPNVEENTGAVCVETLKRDWKPELTLRDVLVTISCLLIQPNPDSALNSTAGALIQEDYDAFAQQAKLMTSIHAPIPVDLRKAVQEAQMRGEDADTRGSLQRLQQPEKQATRPSSSSSSRASSTSSSVVMKKKAINNSASHLASCMPIHAAVTQNPDPQEAESSSDEEEDPSKENNPSLSPSPVTTPKARSMSPRRSALGKRPLSVLPTPIDPDDDPSSDQDTKETDSERNISANISANMTPATIKDQTSFDISGEQEQPLRKSPKLTEINGKGVNASGRIRDANTTSNSTDEEVQIMTKPITSRPEEEKENRSEPIADRAVEKKIMSTDSNSNKVKPMAGQPVRPTIRKTSTASSSGSTKTGNGGKARVGIRRL